MIDVPALRQRNARRATVFAGIPLTALFISCAIYYNRPLPSALPVVDDYMAAVQNGNWRQEASLSNSPATARIWQKFATKHGPIQGCDLTEFKTYNIAFIDMRTEYTYDIQSAHGHMSVAVTLIPNARRDWSVSRITLLPASEGKIE